jgi:LPXTG-motif cell wall-anchored protein
MNRSVAGGMAVSAIFSPLVAGGTSQAQAPEGRASEPDALHTSGVVDIGTLQTCTAHFGLTKYNSSVVQFEETVTGPLTPAPAINEDITPVATITFADSSTVTCILVPAWTDLASFETFFTDTNPFNPYGNLSRYPGEPVYLLPGTGLGLAHFSNSLYGCQTCFAVDGVELELVVDPPFDANFTVTFEPQTLPGGSIVDFVVLISRIREDLPEELRSSFDGLFPSTDGSCVDNDDPLLESALLALQKQPPLITDPSDPCELLVPLAISEIFDLQVDDGTVDVLINSGAGSISWTPSFIDAETDLPATGSSQRTGVLAWTSGSLVLLGAALVTLTRRRRLV